MKRSWVLVTALFLALAALPGLAARKSFPEKATPEEFAKWQTETRELVKDILYNGPAPEAAPLDPALGKTETRENYTLQEVSLHDRPGHITHGWLSRPTKPAGPKLPVIIALHGHGFGAYEVFNPKNMYYYGDRFANEGYIVFAPDIGHNFIGYKNPLGGYGPLPRNEQFPFMGQRVWMVERVIDFMQAQPGADPDRIAVMGLSNGGLTTMFVSAVDPRVTLTIASGSLIMHERMWHRELLHCRCQYLDRMEGELDYYDVFALIAPRPLVIQSGRRDPIFPIASADKAFSFVKQAYTLAGAPEMVIHDVHEGKHEFSFTAPEQWVHKNLPLPGEGKESSK